jgi:hypothetical protein
MENIDGVAPTAETPVSVGKRDSSTSAVVSPLDQAGARERMYLLLFGALVIAILFWNLQFATSSVCCGDFDAYYHFRWSRMLWDGILTGNFPPTFSALPLTTLNAKDYVDHHFLFHIFQIPFTLFGDFQYGAKLGTWFFACLAVFSCYWLLVRYRISYPLVWLVAILGSAAPFLYRIHMGKAMSVSIVMLVIGIHLFFQRKYLWLLPLSFVFALTYDMVYLLLAGALIWLVVVAWTEQAFNRNVKRALGAVGLVVLGIILGNVINPYFPRNVLLLYEHARMKITANDFPTAVGGEWYPYSTLEFLGNCAVAFAAMIAGYIAFRDSTQKQSEKSLFFLLFATFLMLVNMRWRRFSEYWPPFALVFAAFALQPLIDRLLGRMATPSSPYVSDPDDVLQLDDVPPAQSHASTWRARDEHEGAIIGILVGASLYLLALFTYLNPIAKRGLIAGIAIVVLILYLWLRGWARGMVMAAAMVAFGLMGWYHFVTVNDIKQMPGPDRYKAGMEWITRNVPKGELVFNADWDDFPKLFFYDPERPFVAGLDPTYLHDKNKELMKHYERIGKGEEEDPGPIIKQNFCVGEGESRRCARYIFMDHEHEPFFNNALDSGWFEVAYEDEDCSILRLREEKGTPPPDNVRPADQKQEEESPEEEPGNDEETTDEEVEASPKP